MNKKMSCKVFNFMNFQLRNFMNLINFLVLLRSNNISCKNN
jgi:hypothetical protein